MRERFYLPKRLVGEEKLRPTDSAVRAAPDLLSKLASDGALEGQRRARRDK
jgi:hypothetical protein